MYISRFWVGEPVTAFDSTAITAVVRLAGLHY